MKFLCDLNFHPLFLICLKFTNYTLIWAWKGITKEKNENEKKNVTSISLFGWDLSP